MWKKKRLVSRLYKEYLQLNNKKAINKKNGKVFEQLFLPGRYTYGQYLLEKMLDINIISY